MNTKAHNLHRGSRGLFTILALSAAVSFTYAQTFTAIDLGLPNVTAINNVGIITGNGSDGAFSDNNGTITNLGATSAASNINDAGTIVGSTGISAIHAASYSNGHVTDLGTLGGEWSYAYAINSVGTIVGEAYTTNNNDFRAFSYSNGHMAD